MKPDSLNYCFISLNVKLSAIPPPLKLLFKRHLFAPLPIFAKWLFTAGIHFLVGWLSRHYSSSSAFVVNGFLNWLEQCILVIAVLIMLLNPEYRLLLGQWHDLNRHARSWQGKVLRNARLHLLR